MQNDGHLRWSCRVAAAVVGAMLVGGCAAAQARQPSDIHVVSVPEAPGMVCFVDSERGPFHCAPLWLVLDAQYRLPKGQ